MSADDAFGDPQPETNVFEHDPITSHHRLAETDPRAPAPLPGSRLAAERALGTGHEWLRDLRSIMPAVAVLAFLDLATTYVDPRMSGRLAESVLAAMVLLAPVLWFMPHALARARRVPLLLLAPAAAGLGACVGAAATASTLLFSPLPAHLGLPWIAAGASFGLFCAAVLSMPYLLVRLGRLGRLPFGLLAAVTSIVAGFYAGWSTTYFFFI